MIKSFFKKLQNRFGIFRPRKMIDILFVSYTGLIIVPIVILGIVFTMITTHQLSEQAKRVDSYMIGDLVDTVSENMNVIHNITYNLVLDEEVAALGSYREYSYEMVSVLTDVKSTLSNSLIRTDMVTELILFYKNAEFSVSSNGGKYDKSHMLSRFNMSENDFYSFLDYNNANIVSFSVSTEFGEENNYILYVKSIDQMVNSGDIYAIFVLDNNYIKKLIRTINYEDMSSIILMDNDYNCIMSEDGENIAASVSDQKELLSDIEKSKEYASVKIGNKKALMFIEDIPMTKFKICYILNRSHYAEKFSYIWLIILIICMFIICISVFVAKIYSRRIYRPFNNIIELFKNKKTGYGEKSELEFLESKFVEIQQMQNELAEYKDVYSNYYLEKFFYNYLKGYISNLSDLKENLEEFNVCLDAGYYTTVLIKIDNFSQILKNIQMYHFQNFVKENIIQAIDECNIQSSRGLYEFYDHEYIGMIIAVDESVNLKRCFEYVQGFIKSKLEITISVGVGETVDTINDLPASYMRLCSNMDEMKMSGYEFLFDADSVPDNTGNYLSFGNYEEKLTQYIVNKKYDELDLLVDELFMCRRYSYKRIVQIFNNFIIMLIGIINSTGVCADDIMMTVKPYSNIENFNTVKEVMEYLKTLCRQVGDSVEERIQSTSKMNEKIMDYIKNNYMNQISLQTMSEHFGYSKGYFSRYFKKITGKNYVEMLNCYRIEVAKELIKETPSLKLFEVAEQVGFISYKTFSEAFKKFDGRSPESYRNSLL